MIDKTVPDSKIIPYLMIYCVFSDQKPPQSVPSAIVPDRGSKRVEDDSGPETDPRRAPGDSAPKGPSEGIKLFSKE